MSYAECYFCKRMVTIVYMRYIRRGSEFIYACSKCRRAQKLALKAAPLALALATLTAPLALEPEETTDE